MIIVSNELEQTKAVLAHIPGAAERAIMRAMNRALVTARTRAVRRITEVYAIDRTTVTDTIHIRRATRSNLTAAVVSRGTGVPMEKFPHTPKKPGTGGKGKPPLRAEIRRGRMTPVLGGFVVPTKAGNVIAVRKTKKRHPIKRVTALPVPVMMGVEDVSEYVEGEATSMFEVRLAHEINRELEKAVK